jgi:tetratricopeptide (TPR) repeat protein
MAISGCSHLSPAGSTVNEANDLFRRGDYRASLDKYEWIVREHPGAADRALFEMGIIHAYPGNEERDFQKSLECFRRILEDYPGSIYRQDSAGMIAYVENAIIKDRKIMGQQAQIASLEREVESRKHEAAALERTIEALEREIAERARAEAARQEEIRDIGMAPENGILPGQREPVSRVLIEKKERRLALMSGDRVLKAYRIALGGNPDGPKERQGDGRTPEGVYMIDSRNRDSAFHLSLHISYPNEKDMRRARELGVSPGGDIMIHGLKNGFSWVGKSHTKVDWTKGCIAVTDREIEEIAAWVPDGTVVEIRP